MSEATYLAIVLDRSGSMKDCKRATIDGFNEFLNGQQQEPGEATLALAQFDDVYEVLYEKPVKQADKLNDQTFVPRGMTALYDAIGKTVDDLGKKLSAIPEPTRPGKVLVAIITDGYENASHTYDRQRLRLMIEEQQTKYNWRFVFIGANQDAVFSAKQIGIPINSAITYTANNVSHVMGQTLGSYTSGLRSTASGQCVTMDAAFSEEERKQAVAA